MGAKQNQMMNVRTLIAGMAIVMCALPARANRDRNYEDPVTFFRNDEVLQKRLHPQQQQQPQLQQPQVQMMADPTDAQPMDAAPQAGPASAPLVDEPVPTENTPRPARSHLKKVKAADAQPQAAPASAPIADEAPPVVDAKRSTHAHWKKMKAADPLAADPGPQPGPQAAPAAAPIADEAPPVVDAKRSTHAHWKKMKAADPLAADPAPQPGPQAAPAAAPVEEAPPVLDSKRSLRAHMKKIKAADPLSADPAMAAVDGQAGAGEVAPAPTQDPKLRPRQTGKPASAEVLNSELCPAPTGVDKTQLLGRQLKDIALADQGQGAKAKYAYDTDDEETSEYTNGFERFKKEHPHETPQTPTNAKTNPFVTKLLAAAKAEVKVKCRTLAHGTRCKDGPKGACLQGVRMAFERAAGEKLHSWTSKAKDAGPFVKKYGYHKATVADAKDAPVGSVFIYVDPRRPNYAGHIEIKGTDGYYSDFYSPVMITQGVLGKKRKLVQVWVPN